MYILANLTQARRGQIFAAKTPVCLGSILGNPHWLDAVPVIRFIILIHLWSLRIYNPAQVRRLMNRTLGFYPVARTSLKSGTLRVLIVVSIKITFRIPNRNAKPLKLFAIRIHPRQ